MKKLLLLSSLLFTPAVNVQANYDAGTQDPLIYRTGLFSVIDFMNIRNDLFPLEKPVTDHFLNREQKEVVWSTWKSFLDYLLALDSIEQEFHGFYKRPSPEKEHQFLTYYVAFLAQYRLALTFIEKTDIDPQLSVILNERVAEIGLPEKSFDQMKLRFLNVSMASQFAALQTLHKAYFLGEGKSINSALEKIIADDVAYIWKTGRTGSMLTSKNALQIVKNFGFQSVFPVQSGVAEWMGDTKVYRTEEFLITQDQIAALAPKLEPGDIFLERREWYLSNIGLPGYWPHAAFYVGTPDERKAFFNDSAVKAWIKSKGRADGNFEKYLEGAYPDVYKKGLEFFEEHQPRLLEAMSEGVVFTSLEHSAAADSLAVLRPRTSKIEKAEAILRAFHYQGRPYDFNFDFLTDASIVCSELVYKAYEPNSKLKGIQFPLSTMLGRKVLPPNEIVRMFDQQYQTPQQQLDLLVFLDGHERQKKAVVANLETFRNSYKRPKWHILKK